MVCHLIVEPLQFLAYLERLVNFQLISFREIHGHGKGHPRVTTHTHTHKSDAGVSSTYQLTQLMQKV